MSTTAPGDDASNFAAFLASTRPKSARELGEELQRLVGRVRDTGKAGTLTYTLKVAPVDGGTEVLAVNDEIKVRLPEHARQGSLAWPDAANNLQRSDPNTMPLFDDDLRSPSPSRDDDVRMPAHDAQTGEIKEPRDR